MNPEALPSLKRVAIWPTATFPVIDKFDEKHPDLIDSMLVFDSLFSDSSESLSRFTDSVLFYELKSSGLFYLISSDSILSLVTKQFPAFSRLDRESWESYKEFISAESVILTKVSFGREAWGINSYVTLSLCERNTGKVIIEASFNTKWGKSYLTVQQVDRTLPDAIHGAVKGLVNELRKHPEFDEADSE